jgi:hypothetical protein
MNRNRLKYLAALAMLLDHIAWAFVPTASVLGQLMHAVGRLTAPIMLYFLAEGYVHTRSLPRYAGRLALFTLISWVPCSLFDRGTWPTAYFGMIFTMLLGLIAIRVWDDRSLSLAGKAAAIFALCMLSLFGDWMVLGVLWPLIFFVFREDERRKWLAYAGAALCFCALMLVESGKSRIFQFGMLLAPPLLRCYNGEPGSRAAFHKWFFYVFYPAHLLVLWYLKAHVI